MACRGPEFGDDCRTGPWYNSGVKSERLLEISLILLNRGIVGAAEFAERFGVSERTIYRDIEALCAAGIPIVSYPGRNGGYGLVEGFRMDRQLLSPDELSALTATLEGLSNAFEDPRWARTIEKLKSLAANLPRGRKRPEEYLFIDLHRGSFSRKWMSVVRIGIEENRIVSIRYLDVRGRESTRKIEPAAMILWLQTWYLYGFCRLRNDWRMFRMSRIRSASLERERFLPRPVNLRSRPWDNTDPDRTTVRIWLRFTPQTRVLAEDFFGPDRMTPEPDGSVRTVAEFPETEWLYRFLLGFGTGVEILSPERIRARYAEIVSELYRKTLTCSDSVSCDTPDVTPVDKPVITQTEGSYMNLAIASCGLDCTKCNAYIASMTNDDALRIKTAEIWTKEFNFPFKAEEIDCHGCHATDGVQIGHCSQCGIRACAYGKGYKTCAECAEFSGCAKLEEFVSKVPGTRENLVSLRG